MNKPNVLIISDERDAEILDAERRSERWNVFWKIIDYNKLHKKVSEIQELVAENDVDFVLFSRNDQVANRIRIAPVTEKLRVGHSSFSGIDEKDRVEQMRSCFKDFIKCNKRLDFDINEREKSCQRVNHKKGTFSLIFDTEDLGGVKYGLPRILDLLSRCHVKATFFVTNLVKRVYPNILEKIWKQGHEVGLHGMWHDFLSDLDEEEQRESIRYMTRDFESKVWGANFMGRTNKNTLQALIENGMKYFVLPLINYYRFTSYPKLPTTPSLVRLSNKNIWMLPVSVETYGAPWFSIKNMIDSAVSQSRKCGFLHISILCHTFRDGNLAHIETTKRLLHHLVKKELRGIALKELVSTLPVGGGNFPKIDKIKGLFEPKRAKISPPRTKQDWLGIIPENLLTIYRMISVKRGRAAF